MMNMTTTVATVAVRIGRGRMKKRKNKKTLWATITFKDERKRIIAEYDSTKVLDGMVWVVSANGEGLIFPRDSVDIIEVRRNVE